MPNTKFRFLNRTARWRAELLVAVAALPLAFAMPAAHAGQYVLEKGKGVEVCEAYARNLNSFFYLPYPMACERKLDPKSADFSKPKWNEMDVWENRKLLNDIERLLQFGWAKRQADYEAWLNDLTKRIQSRHVALLLAQSDINNDGQKDNILKYLNGDCTGTHFYGTPLLVLNSDRSSLDLEKTFYLLQNPDRGTARSETGRWGYTMYDVFTYKGQSYFDLWSELADQKGFLKVFQTRNNQTRELCSYRYKAGK